MQKRIEKQALALLDKNKKKIIVNMYKKDRDTENVTRSFY